MLRHIQEFIFQLNPFENGVYNVLQKIYQEFFLLFQIDSFHMGSEEVSFECWNSSRLITDQMATRSNMQSRSNNGERFIRHCQLWPYTL